MQRSYPHLTGVSEVPDPRGKGRNAMSAGMSQSMLCDFHAVQASKVVPLPPPAGAVLVFTTKQVMDVDDNLDADTGTVEAVERPRYGMGDRRFALEAHTGGRALPACRNL